MDQPEKVTRVNFYDFIYILVKWRKVFIVNMLVAGIVSSAIALMLPVIYTSATVVLPPEGGGGSALPGFLSADLVGVANTFGFDVGGDDTYQTILESRTLRERIIEQFNLREVYKISDALPDEEVLRAMDSRMIIEPRDNGTLVLYINDQDPQRAADIANACILELDSYYSEITSATAAKERKFIEKRLMAVKDSISNIKEVFVDFQERTNLLNVQGQTEAMFQAAADIKAQQLEIEVKYNVVKDNLGGNHPMTKQLKAATLDLQRQFDDIIAGDGGDMFIGIKDLPSLGQEYSTILRNLIIQNKILEFIYPQYESAIVKEARETSNVRVLDYAKPPGQKSKPQRKLIVLLTLGATFFLTIIMIMVRDYWVQLNQSKSEDWEKVQQIKNTFRK